MHQVYEKRAISLETIEQDQVRKYKQIKRCVGKFSKYLTSKDMTTKKFAHKWQQRCTIQNLIKFGVIHSVFVPLPVYVKLVRLSGECQCEGQGEGRWCPAGQRWDGDLCGCVCAADCPGNQPLNPDTCLCQCRESPQSCLRQGKRFNPNTCR